VIRPVLEYASPLWHSSLTMAQTKALEYLQKRARNTVLWRHWLYYMSDHTGNSARIPDKTFFCWRVLPETSCLHYLLPEKWSCYYE